MLKPERAGRNTHIEPLDIRVFNWVCMLAMLVGVLTGVVNLVAKNPIIELVFSTVFFVISGLFLYLSIVHNKSRYLRAPMICTNLLILVAVWSTNQGYDGGAPYFAYLLGSLTIVVATPSTRWYLFGLVCAVVAGLFLVSNADPSFVTNYASEQHRFIDLSISFFLTLLIGNLLLWLIMREYQLEKQRNVDLYEQALKDKIELEKLLNEINVLKGILPICSFCKKIRDENDTWQVLERYISVHSEAEFSHGFCPECFSTNYPEFDDK